MTEPKTTKWILDRYDKNGGATEKELKKRWLPADEVVLKSEVFAKAKAEGKSETIRKVEEIVLSGIIPTRNNKDGTVNMIDSSYNQALRDLLKELKRLK